MAYPNVQTYSLSGGIEYSFTDSGAPPNSVDYTTLLVIHGTAFNAYQFHKISTYAHAFNLRSILLHRRDYAGSTPYSSSEMEEINQGNRIFWERMNAQLAELLCMIIEQERIPKLTESQRQGGNGRTGGLSVLGWSMGCTTLLSFFGIPENSMISEEQYKMLKVYIGDCMLYEPPYLAFGYTPPSDNVLYLPWNDPSHTVNNLLAKFAEYVSSYYDHPCYDPASRSIPSSATIYDLDGISPRKDKMTISTWTEEEKANGIEGNGAKSDMAMFQPPMQETLCQVADQALFDATTRMSWFPDVKVTYIGGTRALWGTAWAEIETKKKYQQSQANRVTLGPESQGREIRFIDKDGWNHFAHWDQPQEFVQVVADGIQLH